MWAGATISHGLISNNSNSTQGSAWPCKSRTPSLMGARNTCIDISLHDALGAAERSQAGGGTDLSVGDLGGPTNPNLHTQAHRKEGGPHGFRMLYTSSMHDRTGQR